MKKRVLYVILFIESVISFSCKDYLKVEPEGAIPREQAFKTADDAITAVYGLYALMQPCVDQIFLAGDVQSDLVIAARGADQYIAEIAQNRINPYNPYTDFSKFYKLVAACNNAVVGLGDILRNDPVNYSLEKYNFNVAEIICIRAWAYLQLVKIWGDVPYYENPVTDISQVVDIAPTSGSIILDKIEKEVSEMSYPILKTAVVPAYGAGWPLFGQFNNLSCPMLLSEINLYLGNYARSYEWIRPFAPYGFGASNYFTCWWASGLSFIDQFNYGDGNNWQFSVVFTIPFDGSRGQKNNLMRWTSNVNGGIYAIKPSTVAIKRWESQNISGIPRKYDGDAIPIVIGKGDRRGAGCSYYVNGKDTLISKYLLKAYGVMKDPLQNDAETKDDNNFVIFRDGPIYLNVSELWNNTGLSEMAMYPLNGISSSTRTLGGVRDRVSSAPLILDFSKGNIYNQVENFILEERAMESAYEGQRWFDLVRFAKRHSDPSILAKAVASKYPVSQQAAMIARLSNPEYWYWPYYYKNVAANKLLVQKPGFSH